MSKAPLLLLAFHLTQVGQQMGEQRVEIARPRPRQARSRAMVDTILEAAAQVLEATGEAGFNTNAVAERAGVGVGSLYRYFADKRAILAELGRREMVRVGDEIEAALTSTKGEAAPDRLAIRAFLHAFGGRAKARKVAVEVLLQQLTPKELQAALARGEGGLARFGDRSLGPVQAFVLSRALLGGMRAAVLECSDFLLAREFEDELVRLARAYAGAVHSA